MPRPESLHFDRPEIADEDIPIVDELLFQLNRSFVSKARSSKTRKAYESDLKHFRAWCEKGGYTALPASVETIQFYLSDHSDRLALATLDRRLVGIARAHKEAGYDTPTNDPAVRDTLQGIRREAVATGRSVQKQAQPVMVEDLRELIAATAPDTLQGKRDRALLLLAFAGALRAGEVGSIHVGDLRENRYGYILTIRKSKTDQTGKGQELPIPHGKNEDTCAVRAIKAYIKEAQITSGPLIRYVDRHGNLGDKGISGYSVVRVIRRVAKGAGFEDLEKLSGHSLRSGLASSAAYASATNAKIRAQGRWKSDRMVERYVRDVEMFRDNAATSAGL